MSYAEFPHTNYEDTDLRELIALYRKLTDDYDGTLEQINDVSKKLDEYQSTMQPYISEQISTKVQQDIATFSSTIESDINAANYKIAQLEYKSEQLDSKVDALKESIENSLTAATEELHDTDLMIIAQITTLQTNITNTANTAKEDLKYVEHKLTNLITTGMAQTLDSSKIYTNKQIDVMTENLLNEIDKVREQTGANAIKWLWQYGSCGHGFDAFTWYMHPEITAEDWQRMNLTAQEWYVEAKHYYQRFDRRNKVFSPVTGEFVSLQQAIIELSYALNKDVITAGEYERMQLTADEYDNKELNAQEYDWAWKGAKYV